ncbi:hypothetical protein [Streptomyces sp. NPDC002588]|uniref:hypothetical protein n=1 Tax=Streptomyces sp. NPDC002588 TaxID=3154419 RepID=UPI0033281334
MDSFEVPVPVMTFDEIALVQRPVLHGIPGHHLVNDRVSLGRPQVTPLNAAGVERWAGEELGEHARHLFGSARFCLLSTAVNFHHHDREPVESATLQVRLRAHSAGVAQQPLAWDLSPIRAVSTAKQNSSLKLNLNLKFFTAEVAKNLEEQGEDPYLEAEGVDCSDALWVFTRTARQRLSGVHRLHMVIRLPFTGPCGAEFALAADVRMGRIISYDAQMLPRVHSVDL